MRRGREGNSVMTAEPHDSSRPVRPGILALIGNTPMVEIKRLYTDRHVRIWAKLESYNPGGSIKDRVALSMIEEAERQGKLRPGRTVLEATSGNTGIGLALVCAVKGYHLLLTMSEGASAERRKILRALGAEILLTPAERGTDGAIERAYQLAREDPHTYFVPDQFNNPDNWRAHYYGTGEEIWRDTCGSITHVVAPMGTTGTLMGISRRLKEYNASIQVVGVEPLAGHKIQGLKNLKESYVPGIYEKKRLDQKLSVADEEAFEMARRLAHEEGIFAGMSSGAAMAGALKLARRLKKGVIVVILPDGGDRYLSTSLFVPRELPTFTLYNTLRRRKENFEPLEPGKVHIYSCGPTADDRIDLGVCRRVVVADLLKRYLRYKGLQVRHVMNITDLDDRTIQGAEKAGRDLETFTRQHAKAFFEDLGTLLIQRADEYPNASEHVDLMIEMARVLQEKGYAYEQHGSLYFDISKFPTYGELSRVNLGKIRLGYTVDLDDYQKDNPRDFTLFKRSTLRELKRGLYFQSPWGNVRPGWHIECAAMSTHCLGETIDIHTSSSALVFPHHENEIAICEAATGKSFARYWLHSEQVLMDGKTMTRAHGNIVTVTDLLERGFQGREIRFILLGTHYRKPLHFSLKGMFGARRTLQRLDHFAMRVQHVKRKGKLPTEVAEWLAEARQDFEAAMDDDLNVSEALAAVFRLAKRLNPLLDEGRLGSSQAARVLEFLEAFNSIFQILDLDMDAALNEAMMALVRSREEARRRKDWHEADRIRKELAGMGVRLVDTPKGTQWLIERNS